MVGYARWAHERSHETRDLTPYTSVGGVRPTVHDGDLPTCDPEGLRRRWCIATTSQRGWQVGQDRTRRFDAEVYLFDVAPEARWIRVTRMFDPMCAMRGSQWRHFHTKVQARRQPVTASGPRHVRRIDGNDRFS